MCLCVCLRTLCRRPSPKWRSLWETIPASRWAAQTTSPPSAAARWWCHPVRSSAARWWRRRCRRRSWGELRRRPTRRRRLEPAEGLRTEERLERGMILLLDQWTSYDIKLPRISLFIWFRGTRPNLQMPGPLTLMLSIMRWGSVNVWVTHTEAERAREELPVEESYKYKTILLLEMRMCVCVCVCWCQQQCVCAPARPSSSPAKDSL